MCGTMSQLPRRMPISTVLTLQLCFALSVAEWDFDPNSPMVSYMDIGTCGPRGEDAKADLAGRCSAGSHVVKHVPNRNYGIVATIAGCKYFQYTVYECNPVPDTPKFDPKSPLVSYKDIGSCGPRGEDAKANLAGCPGGVTVVKHEEGPHYSIVATIDYCDYFEYTVYACVEVDTTPSFNPASPLVSYQDIGTCGPRGEDAKADLSACAHGGRLVKSVENGGYAVVATINGCRYFSYSIYECIDEPNSTFDPTSPLTSYKDIGTCGPRGEDAQADVVNSCPAGAKLVKEVKPHQYDVVATIKGCNYFAYQIYECNPIPEKPSFDPRSTMVSYMDLDSCGPRGNDAKAELRHCPSGAHIVEDVPNRNFAVVATIDYCRYFAYTVYECNPEPAKPLFDPSSLLVAYRDINTCGPRGEDAQEDARRCSDGYHRISHLEHKDYSPVAVINGCTYFSYSVFTCNGACPEGYYDCGFTCNWNSNCKEDEKCEGQEPSDPRGCVFDKGSGSWLNVSFEGLTLGSGILGFVVIFLLLLVIVLLIVRRLTAPGPTQLPFLGADCDEESSGGQHQLMPMNSQGQVRTLQSNPGPPDADSFSRF